MRIPSYIAITAARIQEPAYPYRMIHAIPDADYGDGVTSPETRTHPEGNFEDYQDIILSRDSEGPIPRIRRESWWIVGHDGLPRYLGATEAEAQATLGKA